MNTMITTVIAILISSLCLAQDSNSLTISVNNATNDNGKMVFAVYTEDTFMKTAPVATAQVDVFDGKALAIIDGLDDGTYAVIALHDLNGNQRMDFDTNGMPQEAYGTSNNPMSYGPPTWIESKFDLQENTELVIRL